MWIHLSLFPKLYISQDEIGKPRPIDRFLWLRYTLPGKSHCILLLLISLHMYDTEFSRLKYFINVKRTLSPCWVNKWFTLKSHEDQPKRLIGEGQRVHRLICCAHNIKYVNSSSGVDNNFITPYIKVQTTYDYNLYN